MKIFEFEFHDNYENETHYVHVLAHSEEEAIKLMKQNSGIRHYFLDPDIEFEGCTVTYEIDKSRVLY